jgi:IS30 family transposase
MTTNIPKKFSFEHYSMLLKKTIVLSSSNIYKIIYVNIEDYKQIHSKKLCFWMLPPKQDIVIFNCLQMQINKAIQNISKEIMIRNGTIQPDTDFFKCLQMKMNKVTKNILKKNSKQ